MIIGERLRELREQKNLSQGDIETRSGLLRCYISRVENGHTVPNIETLEKLARALEIPLYRLFYQGVEPPPVPKLPNTKTNEKLFGSRGRDAQFVNNLRMEIGKLNDRDRQLVLYLAQKMAGGRK